MAKLPGGYGQLYGNSVRTAAQRTVVYEKPDAALPDHDAFCTSVFLYPVDYKVESDSLW